MNFSALSYEGTISFGLGSAPAPGAADDAPIVGIGRRVLDKRTRNYVRVRREGAPNRSRGGCAPHFSPCRFATQFALAALILFFAAGARAETTNVLSDAEIQGRSLATQLYYARPETNFIQNGILIFRDTNGTQIKIPIKCAVRFPTTIDFHVILTNWSILYEASLPKGDVEQLEIYRTNDSTNHYSHHVGYTDTSHSVWEPNMLLSVEVSTPFANSDFWLGDLGLEFFHWPQQKILPKTINLKRGRAYTLLESTNSNPSTNGYSRVLSWIDQETGGILEAEAYDAQGKLLKVFEPDSFEKVNGQWQLQEMEIRNVQTGSRTRLTFDLKK